MDNFKASSYSQRLFCGERVIESDLKNAVVRAGAKCPFVICSPSINRKTDIVERISASLNGMHVGVFDGIEKDSTYASVAAAYHAAKHEGADLLIAVGGGSVLVATRAVNIFLCEDGSPFDLMTQYQPDRPPTSPRLMAPKLPIINIPTTPTSAMNRGGTGLKNPDLDHRMEFFDPKTRPQAVFLDVEALLTAPHAILKSTATTVFASTFGAITQPASNPLVEADQRQAFRLAHNAYRRLPAETENRSLRVDFSIAAFLQNRAEDDGRRLVRSGPFSGDYAVSTALHIVYPTIGQGESTAVVHPASIRLVQQIDQESARLAANALGIDDDTIDSQALADAVATELERLYADVGMPLQLRTLGVVREDLPVVAKQTVKNFNAMMASTSSEDRVARSLQLLEAAW